MNNKLKDDNIDFLFRAILELETVEDCYDFFEDLCTVQELKTISQRIVVAKMLSEKCVYTDIVNATVRQPLQSAVLIVRFNTVVTDMIRF